MGARGPKKQFDRDEVLEKAMQVFWSEGFEGAGMAALVEQMGIGRQSLYDTFGDKRQLFQESLHHYFRTRVGPVIELLRSEKGSPTETLRQVFERWIGLAEEEGNRGCLVGRTMADLGEGEDDVETRQIVAKYAYAFHAAATDFMRRGQAAGEFTDRLPADHMAMALFCMSQGAGLLVKIHPEPRRVGPLVHTMVSMLRGECDDACPEVAGEQVEK